MARKTKVSTGNRGKPITSFFALANRSSRPSSSPLNASSQRLAAQDRADPPQNGENSARMNSVNNQSISVATGANGLTSGPLSPRRSQRVKSVSLQPAAGISSLKRAREPDVQPKVPSTSNSGRRRNTDRRKSKFDSGSEGDTGGGVIYVNSPNIQQRKKPRVSPPTELSRPSIVRSSQSDEEELPPANHNLNGTSSAKKGGVIKRSKLLTPHQEDQDANAMEVDDNYTPISRDEVMKDAELDAQSWKPAVQVTQMLTPPSSNLSSPPSSPMVSVVAKKSTQNIIAAIKARAYAKSFSSPEPDELDFEDSDSSDDVQLPILPLPVPAPTNTRSKGKKKALDPPSRATTRYALRNPSRSPSDPKAKTQAQPLKGADPFSALLKEKNQAAKRGKGSEAIEKADSTVLQYGGKDKLLDEMENEEDAEEVLEWDANVSSGSIRDILNARNERRDDSDLDLDQGDREKILEAEGGKTVLKILEQDKAERCKMDNDEKISGIQLWMPDVDASAMTVDEIFRISGEGPVISLLNNLLKCDATVRTSLLLNLNLMSGARPAERAAIASCLLDFSLSCNTSPCSGAAVNTLIKFWTCSMQPSTSTIRFKDVLNCLKHFGVDSRIIAGQKWEHDNPRVCYHSHHRDVVIPRLVALVAACARARRLRKGEILDISVAMMLIGMDAGTSPVLQQDLTQAIDLSMRCLSPDDLKSPENEFACASRVLQLSATYSPVNKLRLLSLLSNGSGPSRRIADFVAYCMVIDRQSPTPNMYTDLPPLAAVLDQLQTSNSSAKPLGIFALHEGTDYIDLGFYVAILGVAVSNMKGYVSQERQKVKLASMPEIKMGDKLKTDLQLLHAALETLHSKISDSRAAHLERSRTKAAVKQLAMSIHYQREFWLRHSRENKSLTLAQYFKKKN